MNAEKYENIKKQYCVAVSSAGFKRPEGIEGFDMVVGDPLTFNYNNGVVSFIDENGISYITPSYEIIKTLQQAGYVQSGLFVPYANHELLTNPSTVYSAKWTNLLAFFNRCRNENKDLSDEFNVETLDNNMKL